jgi:hypothetical protein
MNKLLIATIVTGLVMPKSNVSNAIHRSAPADEQVNGNDRSHHGKI